MNSIRMGSYQTSPEEYRAVRELAVIGALAPSGQVALSGKDRASYLQGLLTNDIVALTAGSGCYAAWLTPQGRMLTDLHVFESGDMLLLDVPSIQLEPTLQRLDQFLFSEDVQIAGLAGSLGGTWVHGPAAPAVLEGVLEGARGVGAWPGYHNARFAFGGSPAVVARVDQVGVPGFCVYVEPAVEARLSRALEQAGAAVVGREALEAARVEAGYPLFGIDMTDDTIPLEAGIQSRAISLTKGCYVGQEVIIRVLHRGHGRVARKLVGLRVDGSVPDRGAKVFSEERDVGVVTSSAYSPRLGAIALGYASRDFAVAGAQVQVEASGGRAPAVVTDLPFPSAS